MNRASTADESRDIYVTALGTGAAGLNNGRASAGYVVHVDGAPKLLLDAGGGTAARISDAQIDLTALDTVFFGHLHVDHTADFPAIVTAAYQQGRDERPLEIYGPTGTDELPGTEAWIQRLFDETDGAYSYLSDFVDEYADGTLNLAVTEIDAAVHDENEVKTVYERDGVTVEAIPAVHGRMPALAYRITYDGTSFTFTGDYASETDNIPAIAEGTDVLIHNRILADDAGPDDAKSQLHSTATECGANADTADAGTLVLSHVSRDDPADLERERVREEYDGPVVVISDLVDVYPDGTVVDTRENTEDATR